MTVACFATSTDALPLLNTCISLCVGMGGLSSTSPTHQHCKGLVQAITDACRNAEENNPTMLNWSDNSSLCEERPFTHVFENNYSIPKATSSFVCSRTERYAVLHGKTPMVGEVLGIFKVYIITHVFSPGE